MVIVSAVRLKKDCKTKDVKLLGKGILALVDHLFWNLPFCSVKKSRAVRKPNGQQGSYDPRLACLMVSKAARARKINHCTTKQGNGPVCV